MWVCIDSVGVLVVVVLVVVACVTWVWFDFVVFLWVCCGGVTW